MGDFFSQDDSTFFVCLEHAHKKLCAIERLEMALNSEQASLRKGLGKVSHSEKEPLGLHKRDNY